MGGPAGRITINPTADQRRIDFTCFPRVIAIAFRPRSGSAALSADPSVNSQTRISPRVLNVRHRALRRIIERTAGRRVPWLAPLGRHAGNGGSSFVARGYGRFRRRRALPVVAGGTPLTVVPIHASSASGHLWAPRAESAARDSAVGLTPSPLHATSCGRRSRSPPFEPHDLTRRSDVNGPTDPMAVQPREPPP